MAQVMPLPLTISCSSISRLVLPFWYQLTRVVLDKIQKSPETVVCACVCVCVCVHVCVSLISASLSSVSTFGTGFSRRQSVGQLVSLSVWKVYCGKMAE